MHVDGFRECVPEASDESPGQALPPMDDSENEKDPSMFDGAEKRPAHKRALGIVEAQKALEGLAKAAKNDSDIDAMLKLISGETYNGHDRMTCTTKTSSPVYHPVPPARGGMFNIMSLLMIPRTPVFTTQFFHDPN